MKIKRLDLVLTIGMILVCMGLFVWTVASRSLQKSDVAEVYTACGCGGCGGVNPKVEYIHSKSQFDELVAKDKAMKGSSACSMSGCSLCIEYRLLQS